MKHHAPAALRNREPIREVLAGELPAAGLVLEIASGSGEHAVHLARAFPALTWQPSDADPTARASIAAYVEEAGLPNLRPPLALDAAAAWPDLDEPPAAILCINMIHIAPWQAAVGLVTGAGARLAAGGLLYLYGPYRFDGSFHAPSNAAFDASLRARDPAWGVRDLADVEALATAHGFALAQIIAMPANNHSLILRRR